MLRIADIDYVAAMPGSTFRGIHESIVNYAGDTHPQLIVSTHEEASAAIAHGYAKVAGKPMACLVHSTVGLQHASVAIYNAWCDRVPMMVEAGRALYMQKGCYECHGIFGQGSITTGPALAPHPIPLSAMQAYVRNPKPDAGLQRKDPHRRRHCARSCVPRVGAAGSACRQHCAIEQWHAAGKRNWPRRSSGTRPTTG
ncbi:thiamine pyrophosphate-binding protein [Paraburkholderia sp. JHI869]|uniref:thiamine pyrophosphate-binding protein n=1 Tax=Paraburkholderia sp. JHI869 TaxID=3112959 RepID=UPI00319E0B88